MIAWPSHAAECTALVMAMLGRMFEQPYVCVGSIRLPALLTPLHKAIRDEHQAFALKTLAFQSSVGVFGRSPVACLLK